HHRRHLTSFPTRRSSDLYAVQTPSEILDAGTGPATPYGILMVKAPEAWAASHQGKGVRVLVLDTGIDKDHPALKENFEQGKDFRSEEHTSELQSRENLVC